MMFEENEIRFSSQSESNDRNPKTFILSEVGLLQARQNKRTAM